MDSWVNLSWTLLHKLSCQVRSIPPDCCPCSCSWCFRGGMIVWVLTNACKGDRFLTRSCECNWLLTGQNALAAFVTSPKALSQPLGDGFMLSDAEAIRRCAHFCLCTAFGCQCNRILARRGKCYRFFTWSYTLATQATYSSDFCHPFRHIFILPDANSIDGTALISC